MGWLGKSLWTLAQGTVFLLALVGVGAITAVVMLVKGDLSLDDVGQGVSKVEELYVWAAGISGTSVLSVLTRFALPAYLAYRRERNLLFEQARALAEDQRLEAKFTALVAKLPALVGKQ